YGDYLRSFHAHFLPEFTDSDFVDYDAVKDLTNTNEQEFYRMWEGEMMRVKEERARDVVTKALQEKIDTFLQVHREAWFCLR
ncbi:unnamed protein product, partial [Polarella glacialis]